MKTTFGKISSFTALLFVLVCLSAQACHAAPQGVQTLYLEDFDQRDHIGRDPAGGKLEVADGIATLHDTRKGKDLNDVSPPLWTTNCKGTAPPNSYIEARVKASANMMYWFDLVNQKNKSVATIELQEGTGDWQTVRARFDGQFGSSGDDLFIRIKKKEDSSDDSVQIDYVAVVKGSPATTQGAMLFDADHDLALARHECLALSSSFADVTTHYTDNLIDGNASTGWRSFPSVAGPHWVELRWEYPILINQLVLRPAASEAPATIGIDIPSGKGWHRVKAVDPPGMWPTEGIGVTFPAITTDRLRITMTGSGLQPVALSEIEAYGPPQPLLWQLRPYWKAHYIWYPEPDHHIKTEARYFRTTFDIADLSKLTGAFLQVRSNDGYTASINGKEVARGSVVVRPNDVMSALVQGKNCLSFQAVAAKDPGWPLMTLLAQLNINAGPDSKVVATDSTWKCSQSLPEGWASPAFDDRAYADAFICATPPDQPWGRIPYFDVSESQPLKIVNPIALSARAGESATVDLQLSAMPAPDQDLMLVLKAGEAEVNSDRSNFNVARAIVVVPKNAWNAQGFATAHAVLALPNYAPAMCVPIHLTALGADQTANYQIQSADPAFSGDSIGTLDITRTAVAAAQVEAGAALDAGVGYCRIKIGTQSYSPLLWALQSPSLDRYGAYSGTGIHLYHLQIYPYRIEPAADYDKTHFAFIDQHIRHLLAIDPFAKILVEMDVRDSSAWAAAHPDERLVTAQGVKKAASMASAEYAADVSDYVRRLVRCMQSKPYHDSIIGYIPELAEPESAMGGADQNAFQTDRLKLNIGDYNPQAIEHFRAFLRQKYDNSPAKLKAAWKDPAAEFETAAPKLEELTREGEKGGVFRDPTRGRMPFDYFEFLSTMVPDFFEKNIGKIIKDETGGRALVGMYYGYLVETLRSVNNPGALLQGNHFHFDKVIDSPYIDFFMSPLQYEHRMAGDRMFSFQPMDSVRLHKKLYIAEEDLRTYMSGLTSYGRQRSEQESVAVLKNHLGTALIKGTGAWMADWSLGSGFSRTAIPFFDDDGMLKTISAVKKAYDDSAAVVRSSNTQIAVFVSPKTMYYHDVAYASVIYKNLISEMLYTQMPYVGAPFDTYAIEDLDKQPVQDQYQLYIFLNAFFMDDAQRAAVQKLKRDGKTLLFFYAPGFVSNERGLNTGDIATVSGFKVTVNFEKQVQQCTTVASDHPVLNGIAAGTTYTASGFDYAPPTALVHPTAFGPRFIIDDKSVIPLALFSDNSVAFAAKDFGSWKGVYASVPYLDTQALRNIATWAGVHLYTDEHVVVEASPQYVLLHSGFDHDRTMTLHLAEIADLEDAFSEESIAKHVRDVSVQLPRGTTLLYRLKK